MELTRGGDSERTNKWEEVLRFFPAELRNTLLKINPKFQEMIVEIRLRINQPLEVVSGDGFAWVGADGGLSNQPPDTGIISTEEFKNVFNSLTANSFYALEDELTQGFLALPGGHRVGFTGHVLHNSNKIRLMRNFSSINFRIARAVPGIARPVLPLLWREGRFLKTLILSPPASGKTTLLREIIREVSTGAPWLGIAGLRVGLVDERSEIAGSYLGTPQLDVGKRTDVLDGCPKKEGVYLLLRVMNPQLIATDEIGDEDDFKILEDIINAGVGFIATAHAANLTEALGRPGLKKILENCMIERLIFLSNRLGIGTIESVKAGVAGPELFRTAASRAERHG